jgi:hypothetical protein
MSVWTELSGSVILKADSHCSVRECILNTFGDELNIRHIEQYYSARRLNVTFAVTFCADGIDAATQIGDLILRLKAYDIDADIDIKASIRFLA